jgi:hypothetical protein
MSLLEDYVTFLPMESQNFIAQIRQEAQEPLTILAGIHWVAHNFDINAKLAKLLIMELNKILINLNMSNYATINIKSVAALSLTPDRCYDECFGNWEDYSHIQSLIPLLEIKAGRPMMLRPQPNTNIFKPTLWQKLQRDSFLKKIQELKNED